MVKKSKLKQRCAWCGDQAIYVAYHDQEWGVPLYDDQSLFAMLQLEAMQAGLSWLTILKRREDYLELFDQFDIEKVSNFSQAKITKLCANPRIIRHRGKITAIVNNAKATRKLQQEQSFSDFLWSFVAGQPIQNKWQALAEVPTETLESQAMAKALKKQGFKFVGSTICYAFMQAVGMVNDHVVGCYRYEEIAGH